MTTTRAFDNITGRPCPVCLELAMQGAIQPRAVMSLPKFPARLRQDGRPCCIDCQATETSMMFGNHPDFIAARLTVANDRIEGLVMPFGMMEHMGLCQMGFIRPCSQDNLKAHSQWLESQGIPDSCSCEPFERALCYQPFKETNL